MNTGVGSSGSVVSCLGGEGVHTPLDNHEYDCVVEM